MNTIERDRRRVWHPYSAPQADPIFEVVAAEGMRLTLADGRELIDGMSSWWAAIHGYRHPVLDAAIAALTATATWATADLESALKLALIDTLELKPRKAFAPIRVGVTGSHISPPLYESMELLGREKTLARLAAARARIA